MYYDQELASNTLTFEIVRDCLDWMHMCRQPTDAERKQALERARAEIAAARSVGSTAPDADGCNKRKSSQQACGSKRLWRTISVSTAVISLASTELTTRAFKCLFTVDLFIDLVIPHRLHRCAIGAHHKTPALHIVLNLDLKLHLHIAFCVGS